MINLSNTFLTNQSASVREVQAKVQRYSSSGTLVETYETDGILQSFTIERTTDQNKFFGYTAISKINLKIIGSSNSVTSGMYLIPFLGFSNEYVNGKKFYVTEVNRNPQTNETSITAYDFVYSLKSKKVTELGSGSKTYGEWLELIATLFGTTYQFKGFSQTTIFSRTIDIARFSSDSSIYDFLVMMLESTGSIAYVSYDNKLTIKNMKTTAAVCKTLTTNDYSSFTFGNNKRLNKITSIIDEVKTSASTANVGTEQIIYNNIFFQVDSSLQDTLNEIIGRVGDISISQFSFDTFGDLSLELGDKITINCKDSSTKDVYVLDTKIQFDGSLRQTFSWNYADSSSTDSRPNTIANAIDNAVTVSTDAIRATAAINGINGGSISIFDMDEDGNPDNIFVTDLAITIDDIEAYTVEGVTQYVIKTGLTNQPTKVLRINYMGIGISNGANAGTSSNLYSTAVTGEGIVADVITSGTLKSQNDKSSWNLNSGVITARHNGQIVEIKNGGIEIGVTDDDVDYQIGNVNYMVTDTEEFLGIFNQSEESDGVYIGYEDSDNVIHPYIITGENEIKTYKNINANDKEIDCGDLTCHDVDCKAIDCENITSNNISCAKIDTNNWDIQCGELNCADISCHAIDTNDYDITCGELDCITSVPSSGDNFALYANLEDNSSYWLGLGFGYKLGSDYGAKRPKLTFVHAGAAGALWMKSNGALMWGDNQVSTTSSEKYKNNITESTMNGLDLINESKIYDFKYNDEPEEFPTKYGLIIERECPEEIVNNSGDGINLYSMASISWKAIQELTAKIESLEKRIEELERGGECNE